MNDANGVELQKGDKVAITVVAFQPFLQVVGVITSVIFYGVLIDVTNENGSIQTYGRESNQVVKVWDNTKYEKLCAAILKYQEETEDEDLLNRILSHIED